MSQLDTGPKTIKQDPSNNVYTALAFITILSLGLAVGVLWWKNLDLTYQEQKQVNPNAMAHPFYFIDNDSK